MDNAADTTDKTTAPKMAGTQPSSLKPGTNQLTTKSMAAFTTNAKSPKVKKVSGAVIKATSGLINVLTTPKTTPAKRAVVKLSTLKPGTTYAVAIKAAAFKISATIICNFQSPPLFSTNLIIA